MRNFIDIANEGVRLEEGISVIEQLLLECYLNPGISTKELARKALIPIPTAAAVKRELIKVGAIVQDKGARCTVKGKAWVEEQWGYRGIHRNLYQELMVLENGIHPELHHVLADLREIMNHRPQADTRIDQSKCTPGTSLRRAMLCLRQQFLIGKQIMCVGDDDLVSVSIGLLLQALFPDGRHSKTTVYVVDMDERFLHYIHDVAQQKRLPIQCIKHDLREPLPANLQGKFDCFFTDPPYTLQGMSLFLSRGISALRKRKGLPIFLSFAHKSPDYMFTMQREFLRMGVTTTATLPRFNEYEGAEIIANRSQMIILKTTERTIPECLGPFMDALYTGEVRQTIRTYKCKQCGNKITVGSQCEMATIEQLKHRGCHSCGNDTFDFVNKKAL
ncbi:bis-aminopropyl spermidine synthase family protein [Paenibacillus alvei]|uniref:N(4)-bis(aminopropyl)spermidine synthase C-terminal domain-containing protein n=1 Tax=Paenibacillus alvei TaxID=44250 RepID=A0A383RAJ7_PAEAL|nr:bis-aminopropyl spermidine synthase family protein [Paenibacillus alvei]SYX83813.1 conserved protein of unknown function [Paenibacillus alvei]